MDVVGDALPPSFEHVRLLETLEHLIPHANDPLFRRRSFCLLLEGVVEQEFKRVPDEIEILLFRLSKILFAANKLVL